MEYDQNKLKKIKKEYPNFWAKAIETLDGQQTDLFSPNYLYGGVPFKFVDLFAGIGGFRLGLTSLDGECVYSSEWDKHSVATYTSWYNDYEIDQQDFRSIDYSKIPDHDILCGGFPCQPFSLAGVSKKNSIDDCLFSSNHEGVKFSNLNMRYGGCAALDLAYVASGRLDGFFHNNINLWDVAAGEILVKEAGGIVNNIHKFDVNKINIKEIDVKSLRGLFGIVSQEAILFNDTIRNNITFGGQLLS